MLPTFLTKDYLAMIISEADQITLMKVSAFTDVFV